MHAYAGMVKIKSDKLRIADVRLSELALFIELYCGCLQVR
jgi:hypothetical protein